MSITPEPDRLQLAFLREVQRRGLEGSDPGSDEVASQLIDEFGELSDERVDQMVRDLSNDPYHWLVGYPPTSGSTRWSLLRLTSRGSLVLSQHV